MSKESLETTEKQVNIDEKGELQKLIRKLAVLSVKQNIEEKDITDRIIEERRIYIQRLQEFFEESEDVKKFRKKAEKFFKEQISEYVEKNLGWKCQQREERIEFEIDSMIEIVCAAYNLHKLSASITQAAIYDIAKEKMPEKPIQYKQSFGSKFDRIRFYTSKCMRNIAFEVLRDKNLFQDYVEFSLEYNYRTGIATTMLKLIFLIENCNS